MAKRFRLANNAQTSTYDILSGTMKMKAGTWQTTPIEGGVEETMELFGEDTNANLIDAVQAIETIGENALLYGEDEALADPQWVELNADTEQAKRSFLQSAEYLPISNEIVSPTLGKGVASGILRLTHHPLWEPLSTADLTASSKSVFGGKSILSAIGGATDGRIARVTVEGVNGGGGPLTKVWIGVRPLYSGATNFNPVMELEDATTLYGTTILVTDANGSPAATSNNVLRETLTADYVKCAAMKLEWHDLAHKAEYKGRYMVLGRFKVSAGVTAAVRMWTGAGTRFIPSNPIYPTNTSYRLLDLGFMKFPPYSGRAGSTDIENSEMQIYAHQIGGTGGYLYMDALVLIPSKYLAVITGCDIEYNGTLTDTQPLNLYRFPNDSELALQSVADIDSLVDFDMQSFYYPNGGGVFVIAAERASSHVITDVVDLDIYTYPRYYTYNYQGA